MLTTFWPPYVLCAFRFQNYKGQTINHRGRGCWVSRFWEEKKSKCLVAEEKKSKCLVAEEKKASALLPRKKKSMCLFAEEKKMYVGIPCLTPPTMINGSSLRTNTVVASIIDENWPMFKIPHIVRLQNAPLVFLKRSDYIFLYSLEFFSRRERTFKKKILLVNCLQIL